MQRKEMFLFIDKGQDFSKALNVIQKAGMEVRSSFMCLGEHFVPHCGLVVSKSNLKKVLKILKKNGFKQFEPITYRGAQLNL